MPKKKPTVTANDYILLDRSGSMSNKWDETLSSINAYVEQIKKDGADGNVTVAVFDLQSGLSFDVVRDKVAVKDWKNLTNEDAKPRGSTPLYDAIGKIVSMAEGDNAEKSVLVVVTDGMENASREYTKDTAKAAMDRFKSKGWQVIFLGADFDNFAQASSVGVDTEFVLQASSGHYSDTTRGLSSMRTMYATTGASMNVSDDLRAKAKGEKK